MAPLGNYISPQGAANLANHKYSGVDQSILVRLFMGRFWNWLIEFLPRDLAPNLITTIGISCVFFMYVLQWSYSPSLDGQSPGWVYFTCAVCIFLYQTLDNLDGKQARRTGSSSPLGEIFDHGGDSMTVVIFAMTLGATLRFGAVLTFVSSLLMMTFFYLCHWEAYFTGTLILRPLDNPTEAQFGMMGLLLITALFGSDMWLGVYNVPLIGSVQLNHIVFFFFVLGSVNTCIDNFSRVHDHLDNHQQIRTPAYVCLAPLTLVVSFTALSAWLNPSVLVESPRMFILASGFQFSYVLIRLILQGVCKEPFKSFYNVTLACVIMTFNCFLDSILMPLVPTGMAVDAYFIVSFVCLVYLVYCAIIELSTILNIQVFRISSPLPN